MKIKSYAMVALFTVATIVLAIFSGGCSKDDAEKILENEFEQAPYSFKVSVNNNTIVFPTVNDYEQAIDYLAGIDETEYLSWEQSLGFSSMLSSHCWEQLDTLEYGDELFLTLLNPEGEIVIENQLFKISEEGVTAIIDYINSDNGDIQAKNAKHFRLNQDVIAILFEGELDEDFLECVDSKCSRKAYGWYKWYLSGGQVEYRIRYYKAGLYFSLRARMKKNGTGIEMAMSPTWNVPTFTKNKKNCYGNIEPTSPIGGSSSSYSWRPYSSTRSLEAYRICVDFTAYDAHDGNRVYDGNIEMKCNEDEDCSK